MILFRALAESYIKITALKLIISCTLPYANWRLFFQAKKVHIVEERGPIFSFEIDLVTHLWYIWIYLHDEVIYLFPKSKALAQDFSISLWKRNTTSCCLNLKKIYILLSKFKDRNLRTSAQVFLLSYVLGFSVLWYEFCYEK